jgi:Bardet-Biedl syndrome 9 protein
MGGAGNALGFRYYGTQDLITVLASKTSQRYRLQCDAFENLWLLLDEIVRRLNVYHRTHGITNFKISYDGQLPLQEFYEVMDTHFQVGAATSFNLILARRTSDSNGSC